MGRTISCQLLLKKGSKVNEKCEDGWTSLTEGEYLLNKLYLVLVKLYDLGLSLTK
jgi:hypothetical protein